MVKVEISRVSSTGLNVYSVADKRDDSERNSGGCFDLFPYELTDMTLRDIQASLAHVYHLLRLQTMVINI